MTFHSPGPFSSPEALWLTGLGVPKVTTKMKIPVFGDGPGTLRGDPQVIILVAGIQKVAGLSTECSSWSCSSPGMAGVGLWDVVGVPTGCRGRAWQEFQGCDGGRNASSLIPWPWKSWSACSGIDISWYGSRFPAGSKL